MIKLLLMICLAFLAVMLPAGATAESAPYMVATMLYSSGNTYDILEGQFMCTEKAESTYYCVHNWYNASGSYTGIVDGSGYAGFQYKNGGTWTILSIWDTANGKAAIEYAPYGSVTESFGGEGVGQHVLVPYDWEENRWYSMRIQARTTGDKTYYEQYVKPEGGAWQKLAVISFTKPNLGFTWDCFFMEDWSGNNLSRSCQIRGYYARNTRRKWVSLNSYTISNNGNIDHNCMYQTVDNRAVLIQSGGNKAVWTKIPCTLEIAQNKTPSTTGELYE